MYTPLIGDEKRDIVEYTSFGFMNCAHTMLTYTRAMDSALCVPLMIDAAVWCDYFARNGTPQGRVSRALAYLFKVPEGGAQGVDPGFFKQMRALEDELEATLVAVRTEPGPEAKGGVQATQGVATMLAGRVVCAGISCLDLQLCGSGGADGGVETIREFEETKYCPGGSCPQTSTALADLGVPGVVAVTKMGVDAHGDEMVRQASARAREKIDVSDIRVRSPAALLCSTVLGCGGHLFLTVSTLVHDATVSVGAARGGGSGTFSAIPGICAINGVARCPENSEGRLRHVHRDSQVVLLPSSTVLLLHCFPRTPLPPEIHA